MLERSWSGLMHCFCENRGFLRDHGHLRPICAATPRNLPATAALERPEAPTIRITANAIAPGPIRTESFERANPANSSLTQAIVEVVPVRRMGEPDDIAQSGLLLSRCTQQVRDRSGSRCLRRHDGGSCGRLTARFGLDCRLARALPERGCLSGPAKRNGGLRAALRANVLNRAGRVRPVLPHQRGGGP
jgi:hypothetical protein